MLFSVQDNNLSDNEVIIIAVCSTVAVIISKEMHVFNLFLHIYLFFSYPYFDCGFVDQTSQKKVSLQHNYHVKIIHR